MTVNPAGANPPAPLNWPGDPEDVTADDIDFEALAHVLANTCRRGGCCRQYHSIAAHAVIVSEEIAALDGLEDEDRRTLALHALIANAPSAWLRGRLRADEIPAASPEADASRLVEEVLRKAGNGDLADPHVGVGSRPGGPVDGVGIVRQFVTAERGPVAVDEAAPERQRQRGRHGPEDGRQPCRADRLHAGPEDGRHRRPERRDREAAEHDQALGPGRRPFRRRAGKVSLCSRHVHGLRSYRAGGERESSGPAVFAPPPAGLRLRVPRPAVRR